MADGLEGRVTGVPLGELEDIIVSTPGLRKLAARVAADGTFHASRADLLQPGQYVAGALLGDRERERQSLYAKAFAQFPENKAVLKNRIAVGNTVVDHELVIRAPGGEQFEIIAIYTFKDGLISRVDFAK